MDQGWRGWKAAMADALYGEAGFYTSPGAPGRHFRTAAHGGAGWAGAIGELARRVDDGLGRPAGFTIVDVGAGGGELLTGLADSAPSRWSLVGVDVASRPESVPARVDWHHVIPETVIGLLIAVELLDVVPVDVVELTPDGYRLVEVDASGQERLGGAPDSVGIQWLQRWWPAGDVGDRAEIGQSRDELWRSLAARVGRGVAVAVDYAAVSEPDLAGSLTGYREGRQVMPIPDGSTDLTAHVRFDSLREDGDVLLSQHEALKVLGVSARRPAYDGDPATYLAELSAAGEAAALLDPGGLGEFSWLLHANNCRQPLPPAIAAADQWRARVRRSGTGSPAK